MAFVTIQDLGSGTAALGATVSVTVPDHSVVLLFTGAGRGGEGVFAYSDGEFWDNDGEGQWAGVNSCKVMETGGALNFEMYADSSFSTGSPAYIHAYRVLAVVRPEGWRVLSSTWQGYERGGVDLERISGYNGVVDVYPGAALTVAVVHRLCDWGTIPPFYRDGVCPNPGVLGVDAEDLGGFVATVTQDVSYAQGSDMVSIYYRLQETAWTASSPGVDYSDPTDYDTFLGRTIARFGPGHEWYGNTISQVLYPDTRRAVASCITGSLILNPRTDAIPDGTAGNTTGETTGVTRVDLLRLPTSGHLYLAYLVNGTAKLRRVDGYGLALDTASTVQAGSYSGMCAALDEKQGRIGVMLWDSSTAAWSITLGTQDSGGVTWSWSTPVTVQTGTKVTGQLLCTPEGIWLFAYRDTSGVAKLLICRNLSSTGNGTWASSTISSGYNGVTLAYDRRRGILLAGLYLLSSTRWDLMTGTLNSGGTAWSWGTARTITTGKTGAGHFLQRGSGEWIFQSASTGLAQTSVRCKNLQADGTGTWT